MCGISGLISRDRLMSDAHHRVSLMNQALVHRGPDTSGEYRSTHVSLAARRLSIIDLDGGHQPLYNEDRTLVLIANAEIYNHVELRVELERLGHHFQTASDCETILHSYEEYDLDCVNHLRGMFAFALWDERRRRLLLARDPMGEKPVYLHEQDGQLLFASEMKALLRSGLIPFELDAAAVNNFFHYQYVPEPQTAIKGVRKLPAGHLLTIEVDTWTIREKSYWTMEDTSPLDGDPAATIREELDRVGRLVVRADTPVGVALSGGLDSSTVAAFAARHHSGPLHAFTVGYEGRPEACDERLEARALAEHLGLRFHEAEITAAQVVDSFSDLQFWKDDPVADYAGHSYYEVMKLARENDVPVVLQGQGGDELFWGYPQLRQAVRETQEKQSLAEGVFSQYLALRKPSEYADAGVASWASDLGGLRSGVRRMRAHRRGPAMQMVFYDLSSDYNDAVNETPRLYHPDFAKEIVDSDPASVFMLPTPWSRVDISLTRLISDTYLRSNGVVQGDRLSMACSVEMRLPLLDRELVKTIIGLRKSSSDAQLPPKYWLRKAVEGILPAWAMDRPKRGFAPPVAKWHNALFARYGDTLRKGYLEQAGVLSSRSADLLAEGPFPVGLTSPLSFKALVLEHWCRRMSAVVDAAEQVQ